jgi:dsRNA-specific ribonuclease
MDTFNIVDAINNHLGSFEQEIRSYPHYSEIVERMICVQKKIDYKFKNISFLRLAFCRTKINIDIAGKNNKTYMNDTLAQIGDAILDTIISERYFAEGKNKKDIDDIRQHLGGNDNLFSISTKKSLISFCYHESHFHDNAPLELQVAAGSHDSIVEAIIGAIYLDGGIAKARQWIYENIMVDIAKVI